MVKKLLKEVETYLRKQLDEVNGVGMDYEAGLHDSVVATLDVMNESLAICDRCGVTVSSEDKVFCKSCAGKLEAQKNIIWEKDLQIQDLMAEMYGLKKMIRDLENQLMRASGETVPIPKH
jgi:tRNA(Ile2) C34 agmatinyltransferase TiaS